MFFESWRAETLFFLWNSMNAIQTKRKNKKNSAKIFNCGHIRYPVNILKFEYLGPRSLWARNILNLLVSR